MFPMNVHTPSRSPSNSPFEPDLRSLTFSTPPPSRRTHTPSSSISSIASLSLNTDTTSIISADSPTTPSSSHRRRRSTVSDIGERRPKKGDEDYIKRPENAFILFRRKCCEDRNLAQGAGEAGEGDGSAPKKQRQADLSKTISQQWKGLSAEERQYWEDLAKEKKVSTPLPILVFLALYAYYRDYRKSTRCCTPTTFTVLSGSRARSLPPMARARPVAQKIQTPTRRASHSSCLSPRFRSASDAVPSRCQHHHPRTSRRSTSRWCTCPLRPTRPQWYRSPTYAPVLPRNSLKAWDTTTSHPTAPSFRLTTTRRRGGLPTAARTPTRTCSTCLTSIRSRSRPAPRHRTSSSSRPLPVHTPTQTPRARRRLTHHLTPRLRSRRSTSPPMRGRLRRHSPCSMWSRRCQYRSSTSRTRGRRRRTCGLAAARRCSTRTSISP